MTASKSGYWAKRQPNTEKRIGNEPRLLQGRAAVRSVGGDPNHAGMYEAYTVLTCAVCAISLFVNTLLQLQFSFFIFF
jgi:hypothetical protein